MTVVLTREEIEGLVPVRQGIEVVEAVHRDLGLGLMDQPVPTVLASASDDTVLLPMAARSDRLGLALVKLMTDVPPSAGRAAVQRSTVLVVDTASGACLAVLDGGAVTRQRTAAATAVATRHLARPDSRVLGLVGGGNLAVAHTVALAEVLDLERVVVWSRRSETVDSFRRRVREAGSSLPVEVAAGPEQVTRASDVVCTLTSAREPVLRGEWLRPGQHVNAVGAPPRTTHREVDGVALRRSRVVVDDLATAFAKSGDLVLAIAEGSLDRDRPLGTLGEVVAGLGPGREHPDEITLFDSVGLAAQDLALSAAVLQAAGLVGGTRSGALASPHG